ncbi:TetR family transcriptional regulator [Streptomyces sp. FXJ1.4098]|nr:TetR family transcriptional regulator [Streptomyces sp. FXJ1.4098]
MSDSSEKPPARPRKRWTTGPAVSPAQRGRARGGPGGLRRLTYRAVAEEAGVTHGLVVHHFGSRTR